MKDTEKYQFRSTSLFSQLFSASHFHQSSSLYYLYYFFLLAHCYTFRRLKNYRRLITLYPTVQLLKFLKVIAVDKYIYKHIESDDIDIIFYFSISLFQLQQRKCMNRDMENVTSTCSSTGIPNFNGRTTKRSIKITKGLISIYV